MPVEVTKYTCVHRCGKKAVSKKNLMAGHETHCWKNPDNTTCKTCSNEIYQCERFGEVYRSCKIEELDVFLSKQESVLRGQNMLHIRPIFRCQYHNSNTDEKIQEFVAELTKEIGSDPLGTKHFPYHILIPGKETDVFGNEIKH